MKKSTIAFLAATICSLLLLVYLYHNFSSNNARGAFLKNGGFKRNNLSVNFKIKNEYDLSEGNYNVVGMLDDKIIIKEFETGSLILLTEDNLKSEVSLPGFIKQRGVNNLSINPFEKNVVDIKCNGTVFEFDVTKRKIGKSYNFKNFYYKALRASKNSFYAISQIDTTSKAGLILAQFDANGELVNARNSGLVIDPMRQDGNLIIANSDLIYINYYNNNISKIDSSFKTLSTYKTIDTITVLPRTVNIKNNTITKFVNQPRPVNQLVRATSTYLFINSYVKADNDAESNSLNSETIDVYDIKNSDKYKGTIYVKKSNNNRVQDFFVRDNKLILQYPNKTLSYEFSL